MLDLDARVAVFINTQIILVYKKKQSCGEDYWKIPMGEQMPSAELAWPARQFMLAIGFCSMSK